MNQKAELPFDEIAKGFARGKPTSTNLDRFQKTRVPKLGVHQLFIDNVGLLLAIGLDAANKMRLTARQHRNQQRKRFLIIISPWCRVVAPRICRRPIWI